MDTHNPLQQQIQAWAASSLTHEGAGLSLCLQSATGEDLLSIRADDIKPSASTLKVAILLALLHEVDAGLYGLDKNITLDACNRVGGTGILQKLRSVNALSVAELCELMMVLSDNTATNQLIDVLGFEAINQWMQATRLTHSALRRKMMDTEAQKQGRDNTTTARDMCSMLAWLTQPGHLSAQSRDYALALMATTRQQTLLAAALPLGVLASNKVGQLPDLRNDMGIFQRGTKSLVLAVMATGFGDPITHTSIYGGEGETLLANIGNLVCETYL